MPRRDKLSRAEQKARRPTQILDAAFEEFVAKGFSATRLEDIADRVGVTKGTIYVYFETKEELFSEMIRHISNPIEELLRDSMDLTGSCVGRLQNLLTLLYERVSDDRHTRELVRLVISEGMRFPPVVAHHHDELIEPLFNLTQALLDEGVATGEFRDAPAALAPVVVGPLMALMVETLIFGHHRDGDVPRYIRAHIDLVMNGLVATRS
ncbi:TetR/AcrR family transcriptional regulator [Kaistia algarum]|uniref:TetR/AcrR family transcriptional regulator n=1 Tax=Kaistia algarum TaxID=2083279 RepID=UPI000CE800DB|nr:TetR/AcrR family transcriptional regulator [Kaistia algarum]MCX5514420.1 TetR/AcrR family transcriptional regulator [Kaistia algarum]PPE79255.1 TetR/AcrR family transcriptional regulator [Kaistia algarum]